MDLMQIAKFCSIYAARRVKWTEKKRFYKIRHGILIYDSLHSIEKAKELRVYLYIMWKESYPSKGVYSRKSK